MTVSLASLIEARRKMTPGQYELAEVSPDSDEGALLIVAVEHQAVRSSTSITMTNDDELVTFGDIHGANPSTRYHNIAELDRWVERWRVYLGLRTWADQEIWAARLAEQHGAVYRKRRSGRTTRGLLRSIARAHIYGIPTIEIEAKPKPNLDECIRLANDLLNRIHLRFEIEAVPDGTSPTLSVRYVDHHNVER